MSVSDSSSKSSKSKSKSACVHGIIWLAKKASGGIVWEVEISIGSGDGGKLRKTRLTVASKTKAVELRGVLNAKKL